MVEVASQLNVRLITTGAESSFQNELNEKNHSVVDNMLRKIKEDQPTISIETALAWACMAKNTLQMHHGFSSAMIVFGNNPTLLNVITAGNPGLQGRTTSEILANH